MLKTRKHTGIVTRSGATGSFPFPRETRDALRTLSQSLGSPKCVPCTAQALARVLFSSCVASELGSSRNRRNREEGDCSSAPARERKKKKKRRKRRGERFSFSSRRDSPFRSFLRDTWLDTETRRIPEGGKRNGHDVQAGSSERNEVTRYPRGRTRQSRR